MENMTVTACSVELKMGFCIGRWYRRAIRFLNFPTHYAHGHVARFWLLSHMVCRARASARCFAWLRGGVRFFVCSSHGCSVAGVGGVVSNNVIEVV